MSEPISKSTSAAPVASLIAPRPLPDGCSPPFGGCMCTCHTMPGVSHIMPCCYPAAPAASAPLWRCTLCDEQRRPGETCEDAACPVASAPAQPEACTKAPVPIEDQMARWAIDGAILKGRTGEAGPPTTDHWLYEYWCIGQQLSKLGATSAWDNVTPIPAAPAQPVAYEVFFNGRWKPASEDAYACMSEKNRRIAAPAQLDGDADQDTVRLNFVEEHPERYLQCRKRRWSFMPITNYEYEVYRTVREAIDAARAALATQQGDKHE